MSRFLDEFGKPRRSLVGRSTTTPAICGGTETGSGDGGNASSFLSIFRFLSCWHVFFLVISFPIMSGNKRMSLFPKIRNSFDFSSFFSSLICSRLISHSLLPVSFCLFFYSSSRPHFSKQQISATANGRCSICGLDKLQSRRYGTSIHSSCHSRAFAIIQRGCTWFFSKRKSSPQNDESPAKTGFKYYLETIKKKGGGTKWKWIKTMTSIVKNDTDGWPRVDGRLIAVKSAGPPLSDRIRLRHRFIQFTSTPIPRFRIKDRWRAFCFVSNFLDCSRMLADSLAIFFFGT